MGGALYCGDFAPQRKGTIEVVMCAFIFSAAFVFGAFLITASTCYIMAKKGKRVSYREGCVVAVGATVITMFSGCLGLDGVGVLNVHYWFADGLVARLGLLLWPWGLAISTLVALGVVAYFKRLENGNEPRVA